MPEELPQRIINDEETNKTLRVVSFGAEKLLYRPIKCLDKGFVYLIDYAGNDEAVVQAARVSYGKGTKKVSEDRGLIRYLLRHKHTTPFEMVEFKFHCKMPIFVARQWIRHRTASVNEYSARYSEIKDEFYLPESAVLKKQDKKNKQGRSEKLTDEQKYFILETLKQEYDSQLKMYRAFDEIELARELARVGIAVGNYTEWYWKIDLHNLLHFLKLRLDKHAQYEIRVYTEAIAKIVKDVVPLCYEAFEDYVLDAITFSGPEVKFMQNHQIPAAENVLRPLVLDALENKRETDEFMEKLKNLKLIFTI